jgi:putative ABC transport system substrate-binding protein
MRRREFIAGLSAAAWPLSALAQQPALPLIGFINSGSALAFQRHIDAFLQGLKEAGYVEGRNVAVDYRWADGQQARLPELAAALVRRRTSLIVATGGSMSAHAATNATATFRSCSSRVLIQSRMASSKILDDRAATPPALP